VVPLSRTSRFHAGFSFGTVVGALLGVAMVALHVPVAVHLTAVAGLVAVVVLWQAQRFVADHEPAEPDTPERVPRAGALAAWREPRTLLIGVFVLAFAFAEGVGNDWISVAAIDGYHVPAAARVSVIASIGYCASLAGPPTIGLLGNHLTVLRALIVVAALLGVAILVAGTVRAPQAGQR